MNKRIREIFDECQVYTSDLNPEATYREIEFFAEQIVKECIKQGNTLANHYINTHPEPDQALLLASIADYSNVIIGHFGIEQS